jgi:hypothetical protein
MPHVEGDDCVGRARNGRSHDMPIAGIRDASNGLGQINGHVYFSVGKGASHRMKPPLSLERRSL